CLSKTRARIPPEIAGAIERALHATPEARFPSVRDFAAALSGFASQSPSGSLPQVFEDDDEDKDEDDPSYPPPPSRWHWVPTRLRWLPAGVVTLVVLGAVAAPWLLSSGSRDSTLGAGGGYVPAPADSFVLPDTAALPLDAAPAPSAPAPTAPPPAGGSALPTSCRGRWGHEGGRGGPSRRAAVRARVGAGHRARRPEGTVVRHSLRHGRARLQEPRVRSGRVAAATRSRQGERGRCADRRAHRGAGVPGRRRPVPRPAGLRCRRVPTARDARPSLSSEPTRLSARSDEPVRRRAPANQDRGRRDATGH